MATFGTAVATGLFAYIISGALSYTLWQLPNPQIAQFWWVPAVVLTPLLLVPMGKKSMLHRRPMDPTRMGWKLGLWWVIVSAILDLCVAWLYDPTLAAAYNLLEPQAGIPLVIRYVLVIASGPLASERYRRALRKRLGFFSRRID